MIGQIEELIGPSAEMRMQGKQNRILSQILIRVKKIPLMWSRFSFKGLPPPPPDFRHPHISHVPVSHPASLQIPYVDMVTRSAPSLNASQYNARSCDTTRYARFAEIDSFYPSGYVFLTWENLWGQGEPKHIDHWEKIYSFPIIII